jgi:F-type H+-transporting ATPase subunit epsilon
MEIKILTPKEELYDGEVEAVTFPGKNGQFQVLENHAPFFGILDQGEIVVKRGEEEKKIFILQGVVKVLQNKIICLVKCP